MHIDLIKFIPFKEINLTVIHASLNTRRFAEFELYNIFHGFKLSI